MKQEITKYFAFIKKKSFKEKKGKYFDILCFLGKSCSIYPRTVFVIPKKKKQKPGDLPFVYIDNHT